MISLSTTKYYRCKYYNHEFHENFKFFKYFVNHPRLKTISANEDNLSTGADEHISFKQKFHRNRQMTMDCCSDEIYPCNIVI